jgi:hypothetical protein
MAAQFAGSRSLDERRRRRLATESDEAAAESSTASAPAPRRATFSKATPRPRGPSHFPLRKAISARWWKHGGVALVGLALAAGILAAGWTAQTHPERLGPGLARFFDLSAGRLVRWYISTAVFLASQLALLIWWLRSQSLKDFQGRYRGWALCACLGFLAVFAIQTDLVKPWGETVDWLWHAHVRGKQMWSWLVPVLIFGIPAWRFLHREMRDCRTSLALFWLGLSLAAARVGLTVWGPLPLADFSERLVECAAGMLSAQFLFLSLLLHARHAIYISVEPPAERRSWLAALKRRFQRNQEGSRSRKKAASSSDAAIAASSRGRGKRREAAERITAPPMKEDQAPVQMEEQAPVSVEVPSSVKGTVAKPPLRGQTPSGNQGASRGQPPAQARNLSRAERRAEQRQMRRSA